MKTSTLPLMLVLSLGLSVSFCTRKTTPDDTRNTTSVPMGESSEEEREDRNERVEDAQEGARMQDSYKPMEQSRQQEADD